MRAFARVHSTSLNFSEALYFSTDLDYVWGAAKDLGVIPVGEVCPKKGQKFYSFWSEDGYVEIFQGRNNLEIFLRDLLTKRKPL